MGEDTRIDVLFDAMEHHGNATGTEMQLGDAEEFLRQALGIMTAVQRSEFFESADVVAFIEREGAT